VRDAQLRDRLHAAFGARLIVVPFRQYRYLTSTLLSALTTVGRSYLIVEAAASHSGSIAATIRALTPRRQLVGIAVYFDPYVHDHADLLRLGAAGATHVILRGINEDRQHLRWLLHEDVCARLQDAVEDLPASLKAIAVFCVERARADRGSEALSGLCGVMAATLTTWARSAGFHDIDDFVSRCRVAQAIGYTLETDCSVEATALALGFASSGHLSRMLRRYGLSHASTAFDWEFEAWCRLLLAPRPCTWSRTDMRDVHVTPPHRKARARGQARRPNSGLKERPGSGSELVIAAPLLEPAGRA
jgi:AraC-like DNA-binding protein